MWKKNILIYSQFSIFKLLSDWWNSQNSCWVVLAKEIKTFSRDILSYWRTHWSWLDLFCKNPPWLHHWSHQKTYNNLAKVRFLRLWCYYPSETLYWRMRCCWSRMMLFCTESAIIGWIWHWPWIEITERCRSLLSFFDLFPS